MSTPAAAQSLDSTETFTIKKYGIATLSDLQLRIADNSEVQFKVHKQILAHHSAYFQHLIEADPQLKDIELVNNLPVTVADIDLFLKTIYGDNGSYLRSVANHSPYFTAKQRVLWEGVEHHVTVAYKAGQRVSLLRGAAPPQQATPQQSIGSLFGGNGGQPASAPATTSFSFGSSATAFNFGGLLVPEQQLCQQNNIEYSSHTPSELAEKLLAVANYFNASKLLNECVNLVHTQFSTMTSQEKLSWIAKFDEINKLDAMSNLFEKVTVTDLQQAAAEGDAWSKQFRIETLRKMLQKALGKS